MLYQPDRYIAVQRGDSEGTGPTYRQVTRFEVIDQQDPDHKVVWTEPTLEKAAYRARRYNVGTRAPGCKTCDDPTYEMGPDHTASQNCESGKRPHCTCDTCF